MSITINNIGSPPTDFDHANLVLPLHPIYGEFWRSQEKGLLAEVQKAEAGSIRQMVANIFYLAAAHQVRLLNERDVALAMLPWGFYRGRANHIARQFDARLRTPNTDSTPLLHRVGR